MSLVRISKNPSGRQLFVFGATWAVFFGALAGTAWLRGRHTQAEIMGGLAIALPVAGLMSRKAIGLAFVGLSYATYPIGVVVSHVVLALVYYLALTPIGLTMRLLGRDPLERKFDAAATTYWIPRKTEKTPGSYFKQDSS